MAEKKGVLTRALDHAIDWAVARGDPARVARRRIARFYAEYPDYQDYFDAFFRTFGFRGAQAGNAGGKWLGGDGSADSHLSTDLPALRARSQELNRDDAIAAGLTETFVTNVVGTGLVPQAATKDKDRNAALEEIWKERLLDLFPAENADIYEIQRLIARELFESGDVGLKITKRAADEPVWFELIEGERIQTPGAAFAGFGKTAGGNEIRDGVERDAAGIPIAYHVAAGFSNDVFIPGKTNNAAAVRVPASAMRLLKCQKRAGQTRGLPLFHAVLQDLRDLDLLLVASLKRTQIAACLAAFIKSEKGLGGIFDDLTKGKITSGGNRSLQQILEPGMIMGLMPGEEMQFLVPNFPVPEMAPFIVTIARRIGAAVGIAWQMIMKDFGDASYSSARTNHLESRPTFLHWFRYLAANGCNWLWREVMADAALRGDIRVRGVRPALFAAVRHIHPGWRWVDPFKEAKAAEIELRMGITTRTKLCAAQGEDFDELIEERRDEELRIDDLGLRDILSEKSTSAETINLQSLADEKTLLEDEPEKKGSLHAVA